MDDTGHKIFHHISIKTDIFGNSNALHMQHLFFLYLPKGGNQLKRSLGNVYFHNYQIVERHAEFFEFIYVPIIHKYHLRVNGSYLIFTLMHLVS